MKPLKIGITGVRGIVGETFTPELAVEFAESFGTYLDRGRILLCRDTRPSGPMIRSAVLAGLLAAGCEVIDLGVCPTPSMQFTWPLPSVVVPAQEACALAGAADVSAGSTAIPDVMTRTAKAPGNERIPSMAGDLLNGGCTHVTIRARPFRIGGSLARLGLCLSPSSASSRRRISAPARACSTFSALSRLFSKASI